MKNLRTKLAAVVITAAALIAAPAAAQAYTPTPGAPDLAAPAAVAPGAPATIQALSFDVGVPVSFTLTGENGAGITQVAAVRAAISTSPTFTATTNAAGTAAVNVRFPANATGNYTVAATGQKNGVVVTEQATIAVAAAAAPGETGTALPNAGGDPASLAGVWIGGGALLAAGIAITGVSIARRRQAQDA